MVPANKKNTIVGEKIKLVTQTSKSCFVYNDKNGRRTINESKSLKACVLAIWNDYISSFATKRNRESVCLTM